MAEGGSAALRRGKLGEDPLLLPLHRTHRRQPEGPLEDHAQAQAGVTPPRTRVTLMFLKLFEKLCSLLNVCSVCAAVLILVHSQI